MILINNKFPSYWDAPTNLLMLEGSCGLITAWGTLKYFGKRVSSSKLVDSCRYTKKHGTFMIVLAVALKEFGLKISFYSEKDPNPNYIEKHYLRKAKKIGVNVEISINLETLLEKFNPRQIPVVLYNSPDNNGHISPLLGVNGQNLILPYSEELITKRAFKKCWSDPEIYKQCLVASI